MKITRLWPQWLPRNVKMYMELQSVISILQHLQLKRWSSPLEILKYQKLRIACRMYYVSLCIYFNLNILERGCCWCLHICKLLTKKRPYTNSHEQ